MPPYTKIVALFYRLSTWHFEQHGTNSAKGKMSIEEAYEVLGLKPGASEDSIIAAHRKLILKITQTEVGLTI